MLRRVINRISKFFREIFLSSSINDYEDQIDDMDYDMSPYADPFECFAVDVPIEEHIDLHTYPPDETRKVLDAYLDAAVDKGFIEVRIIHGRGSGVQRRIVQSFLAKHSLVTRFQDAPAERGGWGATIVFLEKQM